MTDIQIMKKAIATYGENVQKSVAMEEMSELIKEIVKDIRNEGDINHIIEEIADVYIMLDQLKIMYKINNKDINKFHNYKMKRLRENLCK